MLRRYSTVKVLIATDDADIAEMIQFMCEHEGREFEIARTAEAAHQALDRRRGGMCAVVVDPFLDGLLLDALCTKLRPTDVMLSMPLSIDAQDRKQPMDMDRIFSLVHWFAVDGGPDTVNEAGADQRERDREFVKMERPRAA
jgi:CheY-like chemotaxis protein